MTADCDESNAARQNWYFASNADGSTFLIPADGSVVNCGSPGITNWSNVLPYDFATTFTNDKTDTIVGICLTRQKHARMSARIFKDLSPQRQTQFRTDTPFAFFFALNRVAGWVITIDGTAW